ncbi:MAG: glycosyltransferase [Desulforhopalus sp.]
MGRNLNIAMLAIHSSPLGRLGSSDTGGMSVCLLELASELGRKGHHVDIFTRQTLQGGAQVTAYAPRVRIVSLVVEGTGRLSREALLDYLPRFCMAIEGFARNIGGRYDLIHSNYWLSGIVGEQLKLYWRCPHVTTFHTLAAAKMAALRGYPEDRKRTEEEVRLLRSCDGVAVPTVEEERLLVSMTRGTTAPVYHVPWGVNLDYFTTDSPAATKGKIEGLPAKPLVLFVGRFDPMKGIDLTLRSFYRLRGAAKKPAQLVLIGGDGPQSASYQRIERMAAQLAISDRVHFLGPIEHSQMVRYYQHVDAVVVSSRYESFGLVVLEALASGTPVAATPVGIAKHIIEPGSNGYLAAAGDDNSLAAAITSTLALAARQDSEKIRKSVSAFTWSRTATSLLHCYYDMLLHK